MVYKNSDTWFYHELKDIEPSKKVKKIIEKLKGSETPTNIFNTIVKEYYESKVNKAIKSNNLLMLSDLLKEALAVGLIYLETPTARKWLEKPMLIFSDGNDKTGHDTGIFNSSSAFLCPSKALGHCKQCKKCYALFSEQRHFAEHFNNMYNCYMLLNYDIELLYRNIVNSKEFKKIKELEFVRFNSNGDILNNKMLNKLSKLIDLLKQDMENFKVCYTYTHNKNLNFSEIDNIVVNYSDSTDTTIKRTTVAYEWDKKYLDTSKYVICTGNCNQCPYCKDKDDLRCVVFMAHGGGLKGLEMLPDGLFEVLVAQKYYDWANFYSKLINPKNKTLDDFL